MSLTQVGKAAEGDEAKPGDLPVTKLGATGDRLALVCVNIEFLAAAAFCESPARELFHICIK